MPTSFATIAAEPFADLAEPAAWRGIWMLVPGPSPTRNHLHRFEAEATKADLLLRLPFALDFDLVLFGGGSWQLYRGRRLPNQPPIKHTFRPFCFAGGI